MKAVENDSKKNITNIHDWISTAYHEAGHAIYGLTRGMEVPKVLIFKNEQLNMMEGLTYYTYPVADMFNNKKIQNYILYSEIGFFYAGLLAEKQFYKISTGSDKFPLLLRNGSSADTLSAASIIKKYNLAPPGKERYAFKQKQIKKTYKSVEKYWSDISLIAHALFKKKKLTFFEIEQIIIKKSSKKAFWKNQFKLIKQVYTDPEMDYDVLKNALCI